MDSEGDSKCFFSRCRHNIEINFIDHKILYGSSEILFESEAEFPNKIFLQTPSLFYCNVVSVEINGNKFEGWSINPVPTLEDSNKIVGHNVFDITTIQMAYGFVSSKYGEISSDNSAATENRLSISISDEDRINKTSAIHESEQKHLLAVKVNFELLLNVPKSPITCVIEDDNSINLSIIPNEFSKLPWFPTLSCNLYLTEDTSPFWNSPWNFKCTVPDQYSAIMPGILKLNYVDKTNKDVRHVYEYHYDSGVSFPHLYPISVPLFIGKYNREDKIIGKHIISINSPINVFKKINISNFIVEIIEGYEKLLNNTLPMESITIIFSNHHIRGYCSQSLSCHGRVSDTLGSIEMLYNASSPLLYQENNYHYHLNEMDVGKTMGNIIILPIDLFFEILFDSSIELSKRCYFQDYFKMQIRNLTAPIVALLDSLASLWFGSYIHITNWRRLPMDGWMLLGMKRYLMRQMAKKICGEDLVKCRMKEALERCLLLIENGNDFIPLSVKDLYIQLQQNGMQSCPLVHWSQRESQTLFRLKSDIVFHSLECYVNQMIRNKTRKVGFGFSDVDYSIKHNSSQSKLFNLFVQSFIHRHCIKKNHRNFTTQHFFIHIASCISQQFIHRSKKEIAAAKLPQHEQYLLNEIQDELIAFRSAWIEGVGCPNLTITSTFQFTNKNTYLDNALFTVDQTPIQPPHLTSKEGISSFIPLVSIFKVKKNIPRNDNEKFVFEYLSFIEGSCNYTTDYKYANSITKLLPSFLWPHDPNNIILKESNITILGLGNTGRIPIPIRFGFGPLFDSVCNSNSIENTKEYASYKSNISCEELLTDKNFNLGTQPSKKKSSSASSNGSICSWQLGYMNILCQIFLNHHENPIIQKNNMEWLCTELASHIPVSGGTGKFWPGHTTIYIVQTEENKSFELETIEPQLPISHEIKFETPKIKSGYKRDSSSVSNTNTTPSVCVQGIPNNQNPISNSNLKMNEVPRLSLLHDLQQRKHFVGKLSSSDNIWLQPLKFSRNYREFNHDETKSLQNNYVVNPINLSAHVLWIIADSSQYWLAKISRYQTWSMWDQQFLNETDIIGQLEAANQLGMERYIFCNNSSFDLTALERAFQSLNVLMNAMYHFDWNISIRKRALISILKIHNKLSLQASIKDDFYSIKTAVFSFIKKFIMELISMLMHKVLKELCGSSSNVFICNETDMLLFSIKSLPYLWDSETGSTIFEAIYFLTELLNKYINKHDKLDYMILLATFEAIERAVFPATNAHFTKTIEKIVITINKLIIDITKNASCSQPFENVKIIGILFRILSKHPMNILIPLGMEFRDLFGTNFDPLRFIDLPFCNNNIWWNNYASLNGITSKPLYEYGDLFFQLQALRCYFSLSLQGFTEIMIVLSEDNLESSVKFKSICPEIIYEIISESFFDCNKHTYSNNSHSICNNKQSELFNIVGIFNVWNFSGNDPRNILSASRFPRNLLKTLLVCTLIHIILYKGIQENSRLKNNSNYWKMISNLWTIFISAFDGIIRDHPHLLDEFVLIQAHAEFEPLINSLSSKIQNNESTLNDIKQCCAFISQILLNSPISLSSYSFDPLIFQNISNIYVSLFGHGIPVCMSRPTTSNEDTNPNNLVFDNYNGYIITGIPEIPTKDSLRKRQKFIKRGCGLSDSIQIRRLCDDESYIISRGWKHMCKKITQCLIDSPYGAPFIHPVDENDAPDYYNLIEQPIDLTTIMNKIKQDLYESIEQYRSDINLVFINCKKYNESNSLIVEWSNKVQSEFDQLFKPVCRIFA
ncbi:FALZ protein [Cryptosporidium canis]|uniref:FALZ protein n=1 Tax=Cryptosporidium canis TaxID=195482 RepID=A0A9D5DJL0_9CRYT|nr:FALZ protein [Cryptosporidium canis]